MIMNLNSTTDIEQYNKYTKISFNMLCKPKITKNVGEFC